MIGRILVAGLVVAAIATPARAQNLTLSPSVIELKGRVGQTTTQTLTITNATNLDLAFELEANDVVVDGGKRVFVRAGDLASGIAETAVFAPKRLLVPAGQIRTVTITLTLPPGASNRAIVALFRGTTRIPDGATGATASIGTLMTFALSDQFSLAQAAPLVVVPQSATRNAGFEQVLLNDGSEPIVLRGIAVILNAAGAIVGKALFDTPRALPGERVTVRSEYGGELAAGTYRILATFGFEGKSLTLTAALVVR
jgi:hypothetical protein